MVQNYCICLNLTGQCQRTLEFFSWIKGRKVSFFGRIWLNFWLQKSFAVYTTIGTVRHSTDNIKSVFLLV